MVRYEVKEVDVKCPHGIYIYDRKRDLWVLVRSEGDYYKPVEDGIHIIYFDNTKCPACRKYDNIWFPFVRKAANKMQKCIFVIILCDWFARECKSEAASKSFRQYDIHASPTTLFLYVNNGSIVYQEKYEGVLYEFELKLIIEGFEERAMKHMKGEKVAPPIAKASPAQALESLILQILKEIIGKERK